MSYTFSKIADLVGGTVVQQKDEARIERLTIDSRLPIAANSLFVAIKGPQHNAHEFLAELYERGIRNFIVSESIALSSFPEANVLQVEDSIAALQRLAAQHRAQFNYPVIGITGSNGKTTIKEWLSVILSDSFELIRSPRSYNSQVGVPLSIWEMGSQHNLAIIEAGISERNEMQKLQSIIQPTIGLLSNIGEAHQAGFESRNEKLQEKLKLFADSETLIYRKGPYGIEDCLQKANPQTTISWATEPAESADYYVALSRNSESTELTFRSKDAPQNFTIPFTDDAAIENAIHCIVVALHLGLINQALQDKLNELSPLAMRLEMIKGFNNCTILNDAYSADLHSLKIALSTLDRQVGKSKKTLILSDIEQSGKSVDALHHELAQLLKAHKVNKLIGIGSAIAQAKDQFSELLEVEVYEDTDEYLQVLSTNTFNDEAILVKGARKYKLEKIVSRLAQKNRQTVLEINLNSIQENLNYYKSLLKPSTKLMVMVKALSYGAGSLEVSKLLQYNKVDYLCVAYPDEGVELRQGGIHLPIMVLNGNAEDFDLLAKHKLEPVIYSLKYLDELQTFLSSQSETNFPIHLELDTGMHRLGFMESDLPSLLDRLGEMNKVEVRSIFSHLASSDEPQDELFTRAQFTLFDKMFDVLTPHLSEVPIKHILNTAGIENYPEQQYDMARLGIGLYGVSAKSQALRNVSTLKSYIAQIKELKAGESIGYNRTEVIKSDSRIAIVNIGYGDGLPRKAGNRNYAFQICGKQATIVGNVCMDMCMVDVSDIPLAKVGTEVLVFGDALPVDRLAQIGGTISYEILTGISPRVKRRYLSE